MSDPARVGLRGNLHLVCTANPERGTYLSRQSFCAPIHLSKSYWNGDTLLVNVVNQTAGLFGGDVIQTHVIIEPGARVLLSSPSAARFHPSRGRETRLEQAFEIRAGGMLEFFPEISIPQRESRSLQKTEIHVQQGGEMIYLESLAPGRVSSGEAFAFSRYAWATDVRVSGRLVHRERADLRPEDGSLESLRALFPVSYYAGLILISPQAEKWSADFLHEISALANSASAQVAGSRLSYGGWSIRILAKDSLMLRQAIHEVRALIYRRLGRPKPDLRRA